MLDRVEGAIGRHRLLQPGTRGVVAFSGGPDSLCLLHLLSRLSADWRLELLALCVDHGLREGSAEEAARAETLAASVGVAARVVRLGEGPAGGNTQQRARRGRLRALRAAAAQHGAGWVATGHTADDQAETVMMRALRGTGPRGLAGMSWRRQLDPGLWLVRPLLDQPRRRVVAYLERHGLRPLQDPSNASPRFLRNRLRHQLFPLLRRENPAVVTALCRLADNCRDEHAAVEAVAADLLRQARKADGWSVETLRRAPAGLQAEALRQLYAEFNGSRRGLARGHVEAIQRLLTRDDGTRRLNVPGAVVTRCYGRLLIDGTRSSAPPVSRWKVMSPAALPCEHRLADSRLLRLVAGTGRDALAVGRVAFPLTIRAPVAGDRIEIAPGKRNKVARLLIDAKIPVDLRPCVPVVAAADGRVVLVVGVRRAHGLAPEPGEDAIRFEIKGAAKDARKE
jgi:tRNA(Ile)-lysidine synthase